MAHDSLPVISFESAAAWESWLEAEHASSPGVWLKIAKKGSGPGGKRGGPGGAAAAGPGAGGKESGAGGVSYADALAGALCFGWIDGQKGRLDDDYWLQRFTRRKPGSRWSRVNTDNAARLIEAGRMRPAGLAEVERAKADGRWAAAYEPQSAITVPDDLAAELARNESARAFFETLNGVNRYAILYRISNAQRPETRARRIAKFVAMLAEHKKIYP
jgi:uncharacterized protein YdeI (YjbR/CyaY-like superfamily)